MERRECTQTGVVSHGGGLGSKLVQKQSFSFKDTVVNLDNIIGQPRIKVAAEHPAVKRQLEEMGILETDEAVQRRIEREIETKTAEYRREIEEAMNR